MDDREDMYEIEDDEFNYQDKIEENINTNFENRNLHQINIPSEKDVLHQQNKIKESSKEKFRSNNPYCNNSSNKFKINSKKGDIDICKRSSLSKKNLKLSNNLEMNTNSPMRNELQLTNTNSAEESNKVIVVETKSEPNKSKEIKKERDFKENFKTDNDGQGGNEDAKNNNNTNNTGHLGTVESNKKFKAPTNKNTPSLHKKTKQGSMNSASENNRESRKKEVDSNAQASDNKMKGKKKENKNKTNKNGNKDQDGKDAKPESKEKFNNTFGVPALNSDKKTNSDPNTTDGKQKKQQQPLKPVTPYLEILKRNAESANPNVAKLAKAKLEIEKQLQEASAEKNREKVQEFCVYDQNVSMDFEFEQKEALIPKGERIYMKNLAEKSLKNILEERERKKKSKENIDGMSFQPSLQLTAYYKPQSYDNSHHLMETTCYKNKTVYNKPDLDLEDSIKIEDEIELMKKERKTLPWEEIQKHTEKLYKENEAKKVNRERLTEEYYKELCTYTPDINDKSEANPNNFYLRLQNWLGKQKEKDDERKEKSKINQETNLPFFKPIIIETMSKIEIKDRPTAGKELLDYLHNNHKEVIEKRKNLHQSSLEQTKRESERPLMSPNSRDLNEKNKNELYTRIFELLDYNGDKKISYDEDFDQAMREVPKHIVKILDPLFEEFRENKEVLTIKEFVLSCGRLYNILDFWERSELFNYIFQLKKNTSAREQRFIKSIEKQKNEVKEKPEIHDSTRVVFDNSEKYKGTDFMMRNSKYKVIREEVMKAGKDKQMTEEKKSMIYLFI